MASPSTIVCKHSLQKARWNPEYRQALEDYVAMVNYVTMHAYGLARYILLAEMDNLQSQIFSTLDKDFFYDTFLYCTQRRRTKQATGKTLINRSVILYYRDGYQEASGLELWPHKNLSETANYVADTMWTSYKNNIQMHMGSSWHRAINELLDCKRRKSEWTARRKAEGASAQVINCECEAHIWAPAWRLKETLCTRHPVGRTPFEQAIINELQPVLDSYDNDYEFAKNGIYYDAKANPGKHLKAFIWLEMIFAEWGISCTQALPLQSSWVYAHVPLNTAMLVRCVFNKPYKRISGGKEKIQLHINKYWRRTVDLEQDMFRSHGQYEFMGYTVTDGVSISAVRELFKDYLRARALVAVDLTRFYNRTMCNQRVDATTPEVPLHRKLRLSTYINRQRADQKLVSRLRKKFSPNAIFVMGNWSAPMARYHEPIRGKGWRTLLKRGGFTVYLINEYLTSSFCPTCENRVSTFHYVPNPRPYRCTRQPMVKCHGLLGCTSRTCTQFECNYLGKKEGKVKRRLWNRDLLAVLNFRHILVSLREGGTIPQRFRQQQQRQQPNEAAAPPHPT